jgi:hypothetical protein
MTSWDMPAGSGDRWPDHYERGRPGWPPEVLGVLGHVHARMGNARALDSPLSRAMIRA